MNTKRRHDSPEYDDRSKPFEHDSGPNRIVIHDRRHDPYAEPGQNHDPKGSQLGPTRRPLMKKPSDAIVFRSREDLLQIRCTLPAIHVDDGHDRAPVVWLSYLEQPHRPQSYSPGYYSPHMIQSNRVGKIDVAAAREAAQRVRRTHEMLVPFLREGRTLAEIDQEIARILDTLDSKSCFIRYRAGGSMPPYPNHACLSVNDCVVHGTSEAHTQPLRPGDILKVDIGLFHKGWVGDAAWTYAIAHASDTALKLSGLRGASRSRRASRNSPRATRCSVGRAPCSTSSSRSTASTASAASAGTASASRNSTANRGSPMSSPHSPANGPKRLNLCEPGMLLAVEPMIGAGTGDIKDHPRAWPIHTADASLAVHYEADVLISDNGPLDLTEGMSELPDIVG